METIRSLFDLRNKYPEISSLTWESKEPVFVTVNGRKIPLSWGMCNMEK